MQDTRIETGHETGHGQQAKARGLRRCGWAIALLTSALAVGGTSAALPFPQGAGDGQSSPQASGDDSSDPWAASTLSVEMWENYTDTNKASHHPSMELRFECQPIAWSTAVEDPADLRRQVAQLDVSLRQLGAAAYADEALAGRALELHKLAASVRLFKGQAVILRDIAVLRARTALLGGDAAAALAILNEPTPRGNEAVAGTGHEVAPASMPFDWMVIVVAGDPVVQRWRQRAKEGLKGSASSLPATSPPMQSDQESEILEASILEAVERGDVSTLQAFGPRAARYIMDAALRVEGLPEAGSDPLLLLVDYDSALAAKEIARFIEQDSYILRMRVMRVMLAKRALGHRTWDVVLLPGEGSGRMTCRFPKWLDILAWILEEPDLVTSALPMVSFCMAYDTMTPALVEAVVHVIRTTPVDERYVFAGAWAHRATLETTSEVHEALLLHSTEAERLWAAELLATTARSEVLLGLSGDPDPRIRVSVARSRRAQHRIEAASWTSNISTSHTVTKPRIIKSHVLPEDRQILTSMLSDEDEGVRYEAFHSLLDNDWVGVEEVKAVLIDETVFSADLLLGVFGELSTDARVLVLESQLNRNRQPGSMYFLEKSLQESVSELLSSNLEDGAGVLAKYLATNRSGDVQLGLMGREEGARQLVRALAAIEDSAVRLNQIKIFTQTLRRCGQRGSCPRGPEHMADFALTVPAELTQLLTQYLPNPIRGSSDRNARDAFEEPSQELKEVLSGVATSQDASTLTRYCALAYIINTLDGETARGVLEHLDPTEDSEDWRMVIVGVLRSLDPETRAAYQDRILAMDGVSDEFFASAMATIVANLDPGSEERTRRVLKWCLSHSDEWANGHASQWLIEGVIGSLQEYPGLVNHQLISALLETRTSGLLRELGEALKRLRDPNLIPLLESQLDVVWPSGKEVGAWAAEVLAEYLTEEAAAAMLKGLSSSIPLVRGKCSTGLYNTERAIAQREFWAKREQRLPTREETISELLELMEHDDIETRCQAIHALATLGAVEVLPQLVRLVRDPSGAVATLGRCASFPLGPVQYLQTSSRPW